MLVEQQMIVAEMRARDMPMEILRLDIESEDVGEQLVEGALGVLGLQRLDVRLRRQNPVDAVQRSGIHLQVQIRAVSADEFPQRFLDVEHAVAIGTAQEGL